METREGGGKGEKAALKDRGPALTAGVSGGPEAGKGHVSVPGNGRGVNSDSPVRPSPRNTDIILDLAETFLPAQLSGRCVVSDGLNGFTESSGPEEATGVGRGGGGGGLALGLGRASSRQAHPAGESQGGTPDSENEESPDGGPVGSRTGPPFAPDGGPVGSRTAPPFDRLPRANGDAGGPGAFCGPPLQDAEEHKVANGGFHIVRASGPGVHVDVGRRRDSGSGSGSWLGGPGDSSGASVFRGPGLEAPAHLLLPSSPAPSMDSPTLGSSAKFPEPDPPTPPNADFLTSDPHNPSLPIRPQSLRTSPNLTVSLSCDATPLSPDEDWGFYFGQEVYDEDFRNVSEGGRRQSAPDQLPDLIQGPDGSDPKMVPKRFGLAEFFTRSLFSRKSKDPKVPSHNAPGWRRFGRPTAREGDPAKDPAPHASTAQDEAEGETPDCPRRPLAAGRRKNLEFEPLSTTALILEDRPSNLPAKCLEETLRHKTEYEEMVAGAKRRELKEAQKKKRQTKERHRQEDSISSAMVVWNMEILPHWDTTRGTRRVRELWWQGLPPSVRGRVWSLAIGNELNITPELYEIFLSRAREKWRSYSETSSVTDSESAEGASLADRESSLDLIKLDISRTFPSLFIFQKGGPYHDLLHSVLGAYTCYRPDIGYVQGMSFIAAVLILNLEEAEAFITFANLLNKPCQMAFFRVDHELMLKYFAAFEVFFEENLPRLFSHFQTNNLTPDLYLIDWIFTLYSKSLPLDVACRVWDVFCRDGEESLFRTGLGILRLFEDILLQMDFIHIAQFLSRLPDDLQPHALFATMANTHMMSRNRRWAQVFSALMKDGNKDMDKSASPALRS
ncbi:TBC1 domain family member 12 [Brachionichthys hirsutus]|uniref:TBC1 domain family member 12 n=1 Tax=Brachionichthys hirsutus TaxID=412623 RepID=UPI003604328F